MCPLKNTLNIEYSQVSFSGPKETCTGCKENWNRLRMIMIGEKEEMVGKEGMDGKEGLRPML